MLTRLCRLASLLLTVAAYASVCSAEPIAPPDAPRPALQEETWALPLAIPTIAHVVRPAGKGPFPLVIMNHGVAMDPRERSFFPLIEFRDAAFWFARRGYLVVSPAGPGYGAGGLDVPERGLYGSFFSKIGKCSNPNFRDAGLAIAKYDIATIRYLTDQKVILPDRTIIVGQSAGGWGSIALASQNPAGVKAVVVFAGGSRGTGRRQAEQQLCAGQACCGHGRVRTNGAGPDALDLHPQRHFFRTRSVDAHARGVRRRRRQCRIPSAGRFWK